MPKVWIVYQGADTEPFFTRAPRIFSSLAKAELGAEKWMRDHFKESRRDCKQHGDGSWNIPKYPGSWRKANELIKNGCSMSAFQLSIVETNVE